MKHFVISLSVLTLSVCMSSESFVAFAMPIHEMNNVGSLIDQNEEPDLSSMSTEELSAKGIELYDEKAYKEALPFLIKAAEEGNTDAQCKLGEMYFYGEGVTEDYAMAAEWGKKSAEKGNPTAQTMIGFMYQNGLYFIKSDFTAAEWYRKAAEQGYKNAQCFLGIMYYNGNGVTQDYAKAAEWVKKSALQGYPKAQYILGDLYKDGEGVQKNLSLAFEWYKKAADQDVAEAQFALGEMYENGIGVQKNTAKAEEWYEKAAKQGVGSVIERTDIHYGLQIVKRRGKVGLIKTENQNIVVPYGVYDYFSSKDLYRTNLIKVKNTNGLYGAISTDGKVVIPVKFSSLESNQYGDVIYVWNAEGKIGAYSVKGVLLAAPGTYPSIGNICKGYLAVKNNNKKWGVINEKTGKLIVAPKYDKFWGVSYDGNLLFENVGNLLYAVSPSGKVIRAARCNSEYQVTNFVNQTMGGWFNMRLY